MALELTPEEERREVAQNAAHDFARACRDAEEHTTATSATSLDAFLNYLMTELWDNGFSQTEIREAFQDAVNDLPRYAPGERNGVGIRGTKL